MTREFTKRHSIGSSAGEKELFAHEQMAPLMREPITPKLTSHRVVDKTRLFVTEDVSATHRCAGSPNPQISENELISVIETYARFHATFWGQTEQWASFFQQNACQTVSHEVTNTLTIAACERTFLETYLQQKRAAWGNAFLPEWNQQLPAIITRWAESFTIRCEKRKTLTLIHGDAHLGNVMVPRNPDQATPLLVDWEGISIGIGAWDIALLLHHANLDDDSLIQFERIALENYHRAVLQNGVTDYSYDDFSADYRLSILAYVPHSLVWGTSESVKVALRSLERWKPS
jgi:hypothetical protein